MKHFLIAFVVGGLVCAPALSLAKDAQGVNDYAKAQWNPTQSCVPMVRRFESVCGANFSGDPAKDTATPEIDDRAQSDACGKLSVDQRPTVQKGQVISVTLSQVYIENFVERFETIFGKKRGEIAVVARVAEMDEKNDFDYTTSGRDRGRLVYYSEGVRPKQFLNFSQLPIYGPIEYKGRPLLMEFYILELDVKANTEISGMLTAAAGLGALAYPPASPILKVLDSIGGGLLKGNDNDIEFKYHAALLAGDSQIASIKSGTLEYGNYAFVRMPYVESGQAANASTHKWNKLWFNQKNGRLYGDKTCVTSAETETYFTVQINRAKEEATLDSANTVANFMVKFNEEANTSVTSKIAVIDALTATVKEDKDYRDAKRLIAHANQQRWPGGVNTTPVALDASTQTAIGVLANDIATSLKKTNPPVKVLYDEWKAGALIDALSRLVGKPGKFSPQSFDADAVKNALVVP
jgi:hypothetical protein